MYVTCAWYREGLSRELRKWDKDTSFGDNYLYIHNNNIDRVAVSVYLMYFYL